MNCFGRLPSKRPLSYCVVELLDGSELKLHTQVSRPTASIALCEVRRCDTYFKLKVGPDGRFSETISHQRRAVRCEHKHAWAFLCPLQQRRDQFRPMKTQTADLRLRSMLESSSVPIPEVRVQTYGFRTIKLGLRHGSVTPRIWTKKTLVWTMESLLIT